MRVPRGHAGSWFANWNGEQIPCIHQHWIISGTYIDEGVNDHSAWPKFIEQLNIQRRAIITISYPAGQDGIRCRKSYVGIWEIGEPRVSENILTFPIKSLLHRFQK